MQQITCSESCVTIVCKTQHLTIQMHKPCTCRSTPKEWANDSNEQTHEFICPCVGECRMWLPRNNLQIQGLDYVSLLWQIYAKSERLVTVQSQCFCFQYYCVDNEKSGRHRSLFFHNALFIELKRSHRRCKPVEFTPDICISKVHTVARHLPHKKH
jgi:hypothetical protein